MATKRAKSGQVTLISTLYDNFGATINQAGKRKETNMANINDIFSGNFLKADDLQGKTVRVTISKVEVKEFDDGNKIVLHFQGKDKALVCNKTNANILAENTGSPDTDNWIGTTHLLCVKKVEFQGKLVPAIRVVLNDTPAPPPPKASPSQPASVPDESDPPF